MTRRTLAVLAAIGAALVLTTGAGAKASAGSLTGAGSSFVAPLVSAWIPKVDAAYGVKVTYGPIGSGGGINAITNRTVDFGASDAPLTPDQFAACKGCVQIPWALSATSLAWAACRALDPLSPVKSQSPIKRKAGLPAEARSATERPAFAKATAGSLRADQERRLEEGIEPSRGVNPTGF